MNETTENNIKDDQSKESKALKKDKTIKIKESEHQKLVDEAAQYKDKYVRLYAEFDNARKRTERERAEFVKYASEDIIKELLNVLDSLELSLKVSSEKKEENIQALIKGIELVMGQLQSLLSRNGVKPIKAIGTKFDPHCHEVLMQEETDKFEDESVIDEFQKGYYLGDKVLRTAKVKIARAKQESKQEHQETTKEQTEQDKQE